MTDDSIQRTIVVLLAFLVVVLGVIAFQLAEISDKINSVGVAVDSKDFIINTVDDESVNTGE